MTEVIYDSEVNYCLECDGAPEWNDPEDNQCFLCGPDHWPYNAEANYFCRAHLERNVKIVIVKDNYER